MSNVPLHGVLHHLRSLRDSQALREADDGQLLKRFAVGHEEAPFAALVRRHGPMVWSVSRRILPRVQDAEDVFQAAFLLLARNARSIRKAQSVGSWLHGVAQRLALKTRLQQARRQSREKRVADMRKNEAKSETSLSDVQATLDMALGELPEKYRAVLVLCYLEGKTQEETARQLACPLATVRTRIARGRKLLRDRLEKQGLMLSTAGLGTLLIASAAPAAPATLVQTAVKVSLSFAAGQPAAALCSKQAASLVEGGLKAMFVTKVKTVTAVVLAFSLLGGAAVWAQRESTIEQIVNPSAGTGNAQSVVDGKSHGKTPKRPVSDNQDSIAFSGIVLTPDRKPLAGAKMYVSRPMGYMQSPFPSPVYGTTQSDGRFAFTVPKRNFFENLYVVTAAAPGYGPAWVTVSERRRKTELTFRLVQDDVPIKGQIVDLEGKPVPGATLTVFQINAGPGEDLDPWLNAVKKHKKGGYWDLLHKYLSHYTIALCPKVTTDATGSFKLTGIGRNRIVWAQLDGPTIASERFQIMTRSTQAIQITTLEANPEIGQPCATETFYGSSFRHVAAPSWTVEGVVRDKDTKEPLAGVAISSSNLANHRIAYMPGQEIVRTTTDAQGRYRLTGMPRGKGNGIRVIPDRSMPYVTVRAEVPDAPGVSPVTVDIELKKGVWIEGKLTDKVTGKPCKASVEYQPMGTNPNLRDYGLFEGSWGTMKDDGSYKVIGLPGPGVIGFIQQRLPYLRADARADEFGAKKHYLDTYVLIYPINYCALARVNPERGVSAVRKDATLDPGWSFRGVVQRPDGKPLAGALIFDANRWMCWEHERLATSDFAGTFSSGKPSYILLQHPETGLVGVVDPPKENGGVVTARLGLGATVVGRLVDAAGKPRPNVEMWVKFIFKSKDFGKAFDYFPEPITTDPQGRFRIAALLPGYQYRLFDEAGVVEFGSGLRAGETRDLGDVRMKVD